MSAPWAVHLIFIHACEGHLCLSCHEQCKLQAPYFTWPFKCFGYMLEGHEVMFDVITFQQFLDCQLLNCVPYNFRACLTAKISAAIFETFQKHLSVFLNQCISNLSLFFFPQPSLFADSSLLLGRSFMSLPIKSLLFLLLSLFLS